MSLTELLLQAKSSRSQEFLFIVGSEPRMRTSAGWESLRSSPGLITEWKLLQQSFLDRSQQAQLESAGVVQGDTSFEDIRVGFSFFQQDDTMKAVINLDLDGSLEDIQIPASVSENCLRMKGLVLLSGPGESGQTAAIYKILEKMGEEKSFVGVVFSENSFPQLKENQASFIYHSGHFQHVTERNSLLAGIDMAVFHGGADEESFIEALSLAERGVFVIYSIKAPSLTNAIRRCLAVLTKNFGQHGPSLFAEVFNLGFGQYAISGLGGDRVFSHEVLVVKTQIREFIENENIREIENLLHHSAENSGILTLNQSLLQQLIRRRISIKSAFETSRDPDGLDQLLRKVGI